MTLREYMGWPGPTTHRQYLTEVVWDSEEWNRPDRSDHYLMRIAYEVYSIGAALSKGTSRSLDHFKLKFKAPTPKKVLTRDEQLQQLAWQKAVWLGGTGARVGKGTDLLQLADGTTWDGSKPVLPTGVEEASLTPLG